MLESQKDRIEIGQCYMCGSDRGENSTTQMCRSCSNKRRESHKKWRTKRGKDPIPRHGGPGVCRDCWVPLPENESRKRCDKCREKGLLAAKKRRESKRDSLVCLVCGGKDLITTGKELSCEDCYLKRIAYKRLGSASKWKELKELFHSQDGKCPYTGDKLILGKNAHLDHKLPVSRFPEHAHDIANVEFITGRINEMKRDLTKEEFIELIHRMSRYLEKDPADYWKM